MDFKETLGRPAGVLAMFKQGLRIIDRVHPWRCTRLAGEIEKTPAK